MEGKSHTLEVSITGSGAKLSEWVTQVSRQK